MAYNPEHYQVNKSAYAAKSKAWREKNPLRAAENRRRYYEEHKLKEILYSTMNNRLRKFGISNEEYEILLTKQKGVCAICHKKCSRALAVDHDHETKEIRGLLCNNCNRGLGHFKDSKELLGRAASYLEGRGPVTGTVNRRILPNDAKHISTRKRELTSPATEGAVEYDRGEANDWNGW